MQIPGLLKNIPSSNGTVISMSKKIMTVLSAAGSAIVFSSMSEIPRAYAHVSHVLPEHQYTSIKSGYPDVEVIATGLTGIIAFSALLAQSVQKHRRKLEC